MSGIKKQGQITVFLAFVTLIVLSLLMVTLESARMRICRGKEKAAAMLSIEAALAGYNVPLKERYGIFAVDGNGRDLQEDIRLYAQNNLRGGLFSGELTAIYLSQCKLLSDDAFMPLKKEIVQYMKVNKSITSVKDILKKLNTGSLSELETKKTALSQSLAGEAKAAEIAAEAAASEAETTEKETEASMPEDPREGVSGLLKQGILKLVLPAGFQVSKKSIDAQEIRISEDLPCSTVEQFNQAEGIVEQLDQTHMDVNLSELLLDQGAEAIVNEYILEHFKKAAANIQPDGASRLDYETEFILCGHKKDSDNLLDTINRLALLRLIFNAGYLLSDAQKSEAAHTLAAALASSVLLPFLEPLTYLLIIFAWGYAESIADVRHLLCGESIPLLKNSTTWRLSLESLAHINRAQFMSAAESAGSEDKGLKYADYLRILLLFTDSHKKYERLVSLIQANIRLEDGCSDFSISRCYYGISCLYEFKNTTFFSNMAHMNMAYTDKYQWAGCY